MTVVDAYTPITALLIDDADPDGIRSVVNAVSSGLLVAGSVTVSRGRLDEEVRTGKPRTASVEIVPREPVPPEEVGVGYDRRDEVFDIECTVNRTKTRGAGATPLATAKTMARAIEEHYHHQSSFTIAGATLIGVACELAEVDTDPENGEIVRAVVRMRWTYLQARRTNA